MASSATCWNPLQLQQVAPRCFLFLLTCPHCSLFFLKCPVTTTEIRQGQTIPHTSHPSTCMSLCVYPAVRSTPDTGQALGHLLSSVPSSLNSSWSPSSLPCPSALHHSRSKTHCSQTWCPLEVTGQPTQVHVEPLGQLLPPCGAPSQAPPLLCPPTSPVCQSQGSTHNPG